ncbi:MAG: extracellular solute-binding protein, partial [Clostridia bacterium]
MKNTLRTRIIAGTLAVAACLSLSACGSKTPASHGDAKIVNVPENGDKIFTEPTTVSIAISSSASSPYNKDWPAWKYFAEGTGATFNIQAIPDVDYATKVNLLMTDRKTLPDLLYLWVKSDMDQHSSAGALASIDDNLDKMKNYTKFLDTVPQKERDDILMQRTCGDGKVYSPPVYGTQTVNNLRSWIYRKDILDKHNIAVPTTTEELYQAAKKLKQIYPKSYPVCLRDGVSTLSVLAPAWQNGLSFGVSYNFDQKKWIWGPGEPAFKKFVEFFIKMQKEGLVPPDYLTIATKSWEELMSTDRGFFSFEYTVRIDFFNKLNRTQNPKYTWATMAPPLPGTPGSQAKTSKTNVNMSGYVVCDTGEQQRMNNAFAVLDWMFTDKGSELLSWGKEGETFRVDNGRRQFILPKEGDTPGGLYGIGTAGLVERVTVEANEALYTEEQVAECR